MPDRPPWVPLSRRFRGDDGGYCCSSSLPSENEDPEKRHASIYAAGTSLLLALRHRDDEAVERGAHDDLAREARIRLTCGRRAQDAGLP